MSEENNIEEVSIDTSSDWKSSVSEDYRDSVENYNDINDLVKSHNEAQSLIGRSVRIPGEDASQEAKDEFYSRLSEVGGVTRLPDPSDPDSINQFYNSLGRPETADGYELQMDAVPAEQREFVDNFKQVAHEAGLTKAQMERVADYYTQSITDNTAASQQSHDDCIASLQQQWGPDYENRMAGVRGALEYYKGQNPEAVEALINSEAGNNPLFLSIMADMYTNLKESNSLNAVQNVSYGTSSQEALEKINEILDNPSHPANNVHDPNHKAEYAKLTKLYNIAYKD